MYSYFVNLSLSSKMILIATQDKIWDQYGQRKVVRFWYKARMNGSLLLFQNETEQSPIFTALFPSLAGTRHKCSLLT